MLKIRAEQVSALDQAIARSFEDDMARHLRRFVPPLAEVVGESGLRRAIRWGIERAERHGFTYRGPVRLYIELMALLGGQFDIDPLLPWAGEILRDPETPDQMDRGDDLHERATAHLGEVQGLDDQHLNAALDALHGARFEDYPASREGYESLVLGGLKAIHPRKCEAAGDPALRALIRRGVELARGHGPVSDQGAALFIVLPFMLGHGFASDPFYPWIAETLADPRIGDPPRRVERLHARARAYLAAARNRP